MSKTIMSSMLLALAVAFTLNLHAEPVWTKVEGVPSDWSPLSNNLLLNKTGTTTGTISFLTPVANNITRITDGVVPTSRSYSEMLGFAKDATVEWDFVTPKTLEKIRITTCDITDGRQYDDITIADVLVKRAGSEDWVSLGCGSVEWQGSNGAGIMLYVMLEDSVAGHIAESVTGLRVKFGQHNNVAQYYSEIEAVGFAEATGPVLDAIDVAPLKTKATFSGTIVDVGTDATACDVYLSVGNAPSVKIAESITGSFEYQVQGLTAGTTYAYELSVSNNASTAKGAVQNGEFTTLAADAQTAAWTTSEGVSSDFSPLVDNLLAGKVGTVSGGNLSGYGGSVDLLTNGEVSGETKQTVGFGENLTVAWSFDIPETLEKIRFTTCYTAGSGWYDDIKITKIEVKTSASDAWVNLCVETIEYAGTGTAGTALFATLADAENGFLAKNVTALRITFGHPNNVAQYYAEIEAVGHAERKNGVIVIVY